MDTGKRESRKCLKAAGLHIAGGRRAFTLIELLCVILIISILLAMIVSMSIYARNKAMRVRCQAQIMEIQGQLVEYRVKNGGYPPSISNVVAWLPQQWYYSNGLPVDPWGEHYQYAAGGAATYRLFSKGPDRDTGTDDNSGDDIACKK